MSAVSRIFSVFLCLLLLTALSVNAQEQEQAAEQDYVNIMTYAGKKIDADSIAWVVDRSASMIDDLKQMSEHLNKIYIGKNKDLPSCVVTYADKASLAMELKSDIKTLRSVMSSVTPPDKKSKTASSNENLLEAVLLANGEVKKMDKPAIIICTDETGDDVDAKSLEKALKTLTRKKGLKVYCFTTPATFGNNIWQWGIFKREGTTGGEVVYYKSTDGPASQNLEVLFDFFYAQRNDRYTFTRGYDYRPLWARHAGWAPYALEMMMRTTGGEPFYIKGETITLETDFENKKDYEPDFGEVKTHARRVKKHVHRKAVEEMFKKYKKDHKEPMRDLHCQGKNQRTVLNQMLDSIAEDTKHNLKLVNELIPMLEKALQEKAKKSYLDQDNPTNKRWQANIELDYAVLLVSRYHMVQYFDDVERMKKPDFWPDMSDVVAWEIKMLPDNLELNIEPKKSYVRVLDDETFSKNDIYQTVQDITKAAKEKKFSKKLIYRAQAEWALKMVMDNHPKTPWAATAQDIKNALGYYSVIHLIPGGVQTSAGNQ